MQRVHELRKAFAYVFTYLVFFGGILSSIPEDYIFSTWMFRQELFYRTQSVQIDRLHINSLNTPQ